jgi:hypothetical protein
MREDTKSSPVILSGPIGQLPLRKAKAKNLAFALHEQRTCPNVLLLAACCLQSVASSGKLDNIPSRCKLPSATLEQPVRRVGSDDAAI